MANNKVQLADGTVLLDLTGDTIEPHLIVQGVKAHNKSGNEIVGTMTVPGTDDATAIASHIKNGEVAYVQGSRIVGTAEMIYDEDSEALSVPDWMVVING